MSGERNGGNLWPIITGALGVIALVLTGLWLLLTHCPWFWVEVNRMLQGLASR